MAHSPIGQVGHSVVLSLDKLLTLHSSPGLPAAAPSHSVDDLGCWPELACQLGLGPLSNMEESVVIKNQLDASYILDESSKK